eukprot:gnl/Spiro4/24278_TR12053_c0_g1_i1.p1 gnl/Spiro4/24278_TR12053_c0_g1~~gnl/Spiro4/24278_TR12053_c0_g1_i1.p1  ORF type:complete len:969 (+),score=295.68 gnl/Spiro4/24278_TR12053_c0_g1_i1:78-2984(+)
MSRASTRSPAPPVPPPSIPTSAPPVTPATAARRDFFRDKRKGELRELAMLLDSNDIEKRTYGLKLVISAMTVGKDVSSLFLNVIRNMTTNQVELKKLVYLYVVNYAKTRPEQALQAIATFVRDATNPNPLIRALAIRSIGLLRIDRMAECVGEPLRLCLKDSDAYVRKTAAICVAKVYDSFPNVILDGGFLPLLRELMTDQNAAVVSNAVAALYEIKSKASNPDDEVFTLLRPHVNKLLAALNESSEWGQISILDAVVDYVPSDSREAEHIIERVSPRLQHGNPALVLSAVKVIMTLMDKLSNNPDTLRIYSAKLGPPLVTLLSQDAETQYVALRAIDLIVQRRPHILMEYLNPHFFCKYNDPMYVKLLKLDIMMRLVSTRNIEFVLVELKEYASEVNVEFVRKAVRAVGRCAIKLESHAEMCVAVLLELIQTRVNYVVQEGIVVLRDIFRKYPDRYERCIATVCENLDLLDEPAAKAAMIWILGEYSDRITGATDLLQQHFMPSFIDEPQIVQTALLTAVVQSYIKSDVADHPKIRPMVERVMELSTVKTNNPDLRDRGYMYWRLLHIDGAIAEGVVVTRKPPISDETDRMDPDLLSDLIKNVPLLASVYSKRAAQFVSKTRAAPEVRALPMDDDEDLDDSRDIPTPRASHRGSNASATVPPSSRTATATTTGAHRPRGASGAAGTAPSEPDIPVVPLSSILGDDDLAEFSQYGSVPGSKTEAEAPAPVKQFTTQLLDPEKNNGLLITGDIARSPQPGSFVLEMTLQHRASGVDPQPFTFPSFILDSNHFQLEVVPGTYFRSPLAPGQAITVSIPLRINTAQAIPDREVTATLRMGLLTNVKPMYIFFPLNFSTFLLESGRMEKDPFIAQWTALSAPEDQVIVDCTSMAFTDSAVLCQAFERAMIFFVTHLEGSLFFSMELANRQTVLMQIVFLGGPNCTLCVKTSTAKLLLPLVNARLLQVLSGMS